MYDVSITGCPDYTPETVRSALTQVLEPLGGPDLVRPGMTVCIKANLVSAMKPETAAAVHPVVAAELTRLLAERGAKVVLGDSPGGLFTPAALNHVYSLTGMRLAEQAGAVLNRDCSTRLTEFPQAVSAHSFTYTTWLDQADLIIDLCKLKTHGMMAMTCATKNLFGVIPGTMKPEYHFQYPDALAFGNMLVDLNEFFRGRGQLRLCICDAVVGMEGNGPTKGSPKTFGALLAAPLPYALDLAAAELLEVSPRSVPYLRAAMERGLIPESYEALHIAGDLNVFRPKVPVVQAGATKSWFVIENSNTPWQKLLKKGLRFVLSSRPAPTSDCVGCGVCAGLCPAGALKIEHGRAVIDRKRCIRCFCCQEFCPKGAMIVKRTPLAKLINR